MLEQVDTHWQKESIERRGGGGGEGEGKGKKFSYKNELKWITKLNVKYKTIKTQEPTTDTCKNLDECLGNYAE